MKIIYSLSHDGQPFYIGKCTDLAKRVSWHYAGIDSPETHLFLRNLLSMGILPEVSILEICEDKKARMKEKKAIKTCVKYKIKLTNTAWNPKSNRIKVEKAPFVRLSRNQLKPLLESISKHKSEYIKHYNKSLSLN